MIHQSVIDQLIRDQHGLCLNCGRDLMNKGFHCHHAIYGRDVRFNKYLDMAENLVLLCEKCHAFHGRLTNLNARKRYWKWKVEHGYLMSEWNDSIPMKVKDRFE